MKNYLLYTICWENLTPIKLTNYSSYLIMQSSNQHVMGTSTIISQNKLRQKINLTQQYTYKNNK